MKLVAPSQWLEKLVKRSFLREYSVDVRHNTIDKTLFKPMLSDFRERYKIGNRFMILGVASPWTVNKGLNDFLRLADMMGEKCVIVLVGLTKKELKTLPNGVIGIMRTDSREELASIYSAADIFFNPTQEDNYPTVNLEAEACGTDVMTYDVGGCGETICRPGSMTVSGFSEAVNQIIKRIDPQNE